MEGQWVGRKRPMSFYENKRRNYLGVLIGPCPTVTSLCFKEVTTSVQIKENENELEN